MNSTKQKQRQAKLGNKNPMWGHGGKGGEAKSSHGYITVPAPGKGKGGKRVYKHQVVAHSKKGQVVHHHNRNRADDRPSNLTATSHHRGVKQRDEHGTLAHKIVAHLSK